MELNKIHNIDCLIGLKSMENNSVDYVFTSPPYNRKRNDKYEHYDDVIENWFEWQKEVINECIRVSKKHVIYNMQTNFYNRQDVYSLIGHFSDYIKEIFVWEKTNPLPASGYSITNAVEYFFVFGETPVKSNKTYTKNILSTSVNNKTMKEHKAIMKKEVAEHFITLLTSENDVILDCFMGVGTTAIVCMENNRKYIGFELVSDYCDIAKKRLMEAM